MVRLPVRTFDAAVREIAVELRVEHPGSGTVLDRSLTLAAADTVAAFGFDLPPDAPAGPYRVGVQITASPTSAPAEPYVETRPAALLPDIRVAEGLRVGFVCSYDLTTENALRAMGAVVMPLDSAALAAGRFDGLHTIVVDIRRTSSAPTSARTTVACWTGSAPAATW